MTYGEAVLQMPESLYVTDLDGTLLHNNARISPRTASILNELIDQGTAISVASARSPVGIGMINLRDIRFRLPLILMNGVLLYDSATGCILDSCQWEESTTKLVLDVCARHGKRPFLYCVEDGHFQIRLTQLTSDAERLFYNNRIAILPEYFVTMAHYDVRGAVYATMQDSFERLSPLRDELLAVPDVGCAFYKDTYVKDNWYLEVFSAKAGKHNGVRRLKEYIGAQHVIVFGDNSNDLPMFEEADLACAVANGVPVALQAADTIIGSNEEDGVALFIKEHCLKSNALS